MAEEIVCVEVKGKQRREPTEDSKESMAENARSGWRFVMMILNRLWL